ncbi:hypothetical protein [Actinomadura sp. 9N407]|uniref:hypothetical protein n=1 Tax=Actinomadura sp. 9N407 TaxID=3375154 RepID=UPI00378A4F25
MPGLDARSGNGAPAMLEYAADLVRALAPERSWPTRLRGVAVGFDDGDFVLTWTA